MYNLIKSIKSFFSPAFIYLFQSTGSHLLFSYNNSFNLFLYDIPLLPTSFVIEILIVITQIFISEILLITNFYITILIIIIIYQSLIGILK